MKENLKDYFYFSRSEKNGLVILLIIIIFLIIFPFFYNFVFTKKETIHTDFDKEIQQFTQSLSKTEEPVYKDKLDQYIIERYDSLELFFFNPNNTSKENFIKLGLTENQTKTILNYISKGGKFRIKQDFAKIYGIRAAQYQILEPYLLLPDERFQDYSDKNKLYSGTPDENQSELFVFDPNTASDDQYKRLGISESVIKTVRNYQAKIGKFKTKEDFKKIYGLSEEKYVQLEPYINIKKEEEKLQEKVLIELNSAKIEDLIQIKGIGKTYAEAICKYRQKLGGYVNVEQILDIKIIDPEIYSSFKPYIYTDKNKIAVINLNFAEMEDLASHPYLNYYQAKEIIKFRSINGPFQDKKQLLQNKILMEQTFKKIEPYLTIE